MTTQDLTGTLYIQRGMAIAIRKQFKLQLKFIIDQLKDKKYHIESFIRVESKLNIDAMDIIMGAMTDIDDILKNPINQFIALSWMKSSKDTRRIIRHPLATPDRRIMRLLQNNTLSYVKKFNREQRSKLRSVLTDGITQGDSISSIAKEIKKSFNILTWRSEVISRSEVIRTYNYGTRETMKAGGVYKYKWKTNIRHNSGKVDIALNGRVFDIRSTGKMTVAGKQISRSPVPVTDTHPNCGCITIPIVTVE